jgi:predicted peptidase
MLEAPESCNDNGCSLFHRKLNHQGQRPASTAFVPLQESREAGIRSLVTGVALSGIPDSMAILRQLTIQREDTIHYLIDQPNNDIPASGWPLVLFLHGAGERGNDPGLLTRHGPPRMAAEGCQFSFILAAPQCPEGDHWSTRSLIRLVDALVAEYPVDPQRIYLTGISMGGFGTWDLACEHPERFAAIAPICGGGELLRSLLQTGAKREALQKLPVWAFHGEVDYVVPVEESRRMVEIFRRLGNEHVKLTTYPDVGHDSWTQTYAESGVLDWLLEQRR